jgi:hypothetical protein
MKPFGMRRHDIVGIDAIDIGEAFFYARNKDAPLMVMRHSRDPTPLGQSVIKQPAAAGGDDKEYSQIKTVVIHLLARLGEREKVIGEMGAEMGVSLFEIIEFMP